MYNIANNNKAEQQTEHTKEEQAFLKALYMPRVSLLKKIKALVDVTPAVEEYTPAVEEANHARLRLAASLYRRPEFALVFGSMYVLSAYIKENLYSLVDLLTVNAPKKTTVSKAIVDSAIMDYALSLTNGTTARAKGVVDSLKHTALTIAYYKDSERALLEYTAVDSALNKVYAAARRQAKKNGVEIAKSNKVTKDAVKTAMLERILEMCKNHEYAFEVMIGETP